MARFSDFTILFGSEEELARRFDFLCNFVQESQPFDEAGKLCVFEKIISALDVVQTEDAVFTQYLRCRTLKEMRLLKSKGSMSGGTYDPDDEL
jgi:hypothetical protein